MKRTIAPAMLALVLVALAAFAPITQAEVGGTITKSVTADTSVITSASTTPTSDSSGTVAGLLAQLAKLTALFNDLKAKLAGTQAEIKELRADIKEGMTDADITTIQELLASDPTIYPRGLVTGYFGPMTTEAIKKFQAKNGLEVTGEIDTETRAAMDAIIAERKADGKFPIGLLLAPGLKDKFEDKLKARCDDFVKATTTAAHPCARVKAKYNFWTDKMDDRKEKMEDKRKMKDDDDEDENEDESDDDNDDNDDTDEDENDDN